MRDLFQTPQEIRQQIWKELGRASKDRHHAWRTPVLATTDDSGTVNARTVVLRDVHAALGHLIVFTDSRSPKVVEICSRQAALFVFWSSRLRWQLRARVNMSVQTSGPEVQAYWQQVSQSAGAKDYMTQTAPGTAWSDDAERAEPLRQVPNFSVLTAEVTEIDWLELGRDAHRRARILGSEWEWLTP